MAIHIFYQRPAEFTQIEFRGEMSELNEMLAAVDHYHEHDDHPIIEVSTRAGKVLAYVVDRKGPAPDGVSPEAIVLGRRIFLAAKNGVKLLPANHADNRTSPPPEESP